MPQEIEYGNTPVLILYLHYQASIKQYVISFEKQLMRRQKYERVAKWHI